MSHCSTTKIFPPAAGIPWEDGSQGMPPLGPQHPSAAQETSSDTGDGQQQSWGWGLIWKSPAAVSTRIHLIIRGKGSSGSPFFLKCKWNVARRLLRKSRARFPFSVWRSSKSCWGLWPECEALPNAPASARHWRHKARKWQFTLLLGKDPSCCFLPPDLTGSHWNLHGSVNETNGIHCDFRLPSRSGP